jgi:hypothetical protein
VVEGAKPIAIRTTIGSFFMTTAPREIQISAIGSFPEGRRIPLAEIADTS